MADLRVQFAGLELKNPIVAASGPLGRTYESLRRSIEAGCGAVTLKSNNAVPEDTSEPRPSAEIFARTAHTFLRKYGLSKMMLNWEGVPVEFTAEEQRKMIERIKPIAREHGCLVIANMHPDPLYGQDLETFRQDMRTILSAGPDMIEFCVCPYHLPHEATYPENQNYDMIDMVMGSIYAVAAEVADIPIIAKHNGPIFNRSANTFTGHGVKGFHVTEGPQFYGTVVDIDTMQPIAPGPAVITYGAHRRPMMNLQSARTRALGDNFDVMSSGGVWTMNDVIERMMCGSQLVGLHTAIQYHGQKLFTKIIKQMNAWLDKRGLDVADIVGKAVPQIVSHEAHDAFMRQHDRSTEQIRPVIDPDGCNGCTLCANCIHGGIFMEEKKAWTRLENCVRCGICESICPTNAVVMQMQ